MNPVEINRQNFKNFHLTNTIAFSLAGSGAGGEPGGIWMIVDTGMIYHTNSIQNEFTPEELKAICPPLECCTFGLFGGKAQNGWHIHYMGMGNFLAIHESIKTSFDLMVQASSYDLYKNWKKIVISVLPLVKGKRNLRILVNHC